MLIQAHKVISNFSAHEETSTLKPFLIPWLAFQMSIDIFMSGAHRSASWSAPLVN